MKKKVLILGKTGMLGHMVQRVLAESDLIMLQGTHFDDENDPFYLDVMNGLGYLEAICNRSNGYDYFINCIGMVTLKATENDPSAIRSAIRLNAVFPHELASFAEKRRTKVIHISTDGVFSGKADVYFEDDSPDCCDLYGITKSLGEAANECFLNIRCSIVGPSPFEKRGILEWFLQQPDDGIVSGYSNQIWNGVSTYQFGNLCREIIEGDYFGKLREESPIFHFSPNESVTKYDLLCLFNEFFDKHVKINPVVCEVRLRRILSTRFKGIKDIFPYCTTAPKMVFELAQFMKKI